RASGARRSCGWCGDPPLEGRGIACGRELAKLLLTKGKWILKEAPDSKGAADGALFGMLFGPAGSSGRKLVARSHGAVVHRTFGNAVRSQELLRHSAVCEDQDS